MSTNWQQIRQRRRDYSLSGRASRFKSTQSSHQNVREHAKWGKWRGTNRIGEHTQGKRRPPGHRLSGQSPDPELICRHKVRRKEAFPFPHWPDLATGGLTAKRWSVVKCEKAGRKDYGRGSKKSASNLLWREAKKEDHFGFGGVALDWIKLVRLRTGTGNWPCPDYWCHWRTAFGHMRYLAGMDEWNCLTVYFPKLNS